MRDKYLDLARDLKKSMEHEKDCDINCNWYVWNDRHRLDKGTGTIKNRRTNRDHSNYSITKIGQSTTKSPGDLERLAITQTPVKDYQH